MALDSIRGLVDSADKEVADVVVAEQNLATARGEYDQAAATAAEKQAAVDEARQAVTGEKGEAIASLRAIAAAVQEQIAMLEATQT